jgi:ABC-type transport system substrate-binding protein
MPFLLLTTASLLTAALTAGCGNTGGAGATTAGVLRESFPEEPPTLDPAMAQDTYTGDLLENAYEGLIGWNEKNQIVPKIASALPKISADGKTYTFTLRDNAKFANGRKITADDVKYSLTRALDPKLASPVAMSYLDDIAGARAVADGKTTDLSGVAVVDPSTVRITLVAPRAYFLGKMTYPTAYVVAKEAVESGPLSAGGAHTLDGTNSADASSGPFRITEYVRQSHVSLEPNPNYWDGKPRLTRIERTIVLDSKTAINLYQTDRLDMVINLQQSDYDSLKSDPALSKDVHLFPRAATWYLSVSPVNYAPFRDLRVRQAIAYAVDKESIIRDVTHGVYVMAGGVLPPGIPGYDTGLKGYGYDPSRSKQLLEQAGYPGGKGLPPMRIIYPEKQSNFSHPVEVLREQLQAVGFPVELSEMEHGAFIHALHNRQFELAYGAWYADYIDPQDFLSLLFRSDAPENETGYNNPQFDALVGKADAERDPTKRDREYAQADAMLVHDIPWVPIAYGRDIELIKPGVTGIRDALMEHLPNTDVQVN